MPVTTVHKERGFGLIRDGFSRYRTATLFKRKCDILLKLSEQLQQLQRQTNHQLQVIHTYSGTEFVKKPVRKYLSSIGAKFELFTPGFLQ